MQKIKCRSCDKELYYNTISDLSAFPFCSERCKLIDLGAWLYEDRRIEEPISDDNLKESDT